MHYRMYCPSCAWIVLFSAVDVIKRSTTCCTRKELYRGWVICDCLYNRELLQRTTYLTDVRDYLQVSRNLTRYKAASVCCFLLSVRCWMSPGKSQLHNYKPHIHTSFCIGPFFHAWSTSECTISEQRTIPIQTVADNLPSHLSVHNYA